MRIVFENKPNGKFSLRQEAETAGDIVSFPREFLADVTLLETQPLNALVAAMILFQISEESGVVTSPPSTAQLDRSLRRVLGEHSPQLTVDPLLSVVPENHTQLLVGKFREGKVAVQPEGKGRNVLVQYLDSARWTGKLFSVDRVVVATNVSAFDETVLSPTAFRVALGLLMAGDWKSSSLVVEKADDEQGLFSTGMMQELCAAIGVRLVFVNEQEMEGMLQDGQA
ncbi:hypothetical protein [Corynebacterium afermentans]|uniref:hypothetical protein n=1 Tax=Corynebacterium afermentans TaxID=38286 RepID=UPI002572C004|nr:hypothetical protein [Corynebacterium afermentans]MDC7109705.1 hypothetical protein [Corynebacterium afermentans]